MPICDIQMPYIQGALSDLKTQTPRFAISDISRNMLPPAPPTPVIYLPCHQTIKFVLESL